MLFSTLLIPSNGCISIGCLSYMISYHIIIIIKSVKLFSDGKNDKGIAAGWGKTNVFGGGSTLAMKFVSLTILLKPNMNIRYFENRLEKPSTTCFKKITN